MNTSNPVEDLAEILEEDFSCEQNLTSEWYHSLSKVAIEEGNEWLWLENAIGTISQQEAEYLKGMIQMYRILLEKEVN